MLNHVTVLALLATPIFSATAVLFLCRHRHTWTARAVDHGVMSEPRRNATAILYVCSTCGEAKSTTVAGTYQLEDVRCLSTIADLPKHDSSTEIGWSPADRLFAKNVRVKL